MSTLPLPNKDPRGRRGSEALTLIMGGDESHIIPSEVEEHQEESNVMKNPEEVVLTSPSKRTKKEFKAEKEELKEEKKCYKNYLTFLFTIILMIPGKI